MKGLTLRRGGRRKKEEEEEDEEEEEEEEEEEDHGCETDNDSKSDADSTDSVWGHFSNNGNATDDEGAQSEVDATGQSVTGKIVKESPGYEASIFEAIRNTKKESDNIKFKETKNAHEFRTWKLNFKKKVASSSGCPSKAFLWIGEIEKATSIDDLKTVPGNYFETLDAKVATGLMDILHGEFLRKMTVLEEQYSNKGEMLNGRQIAFEIYKYYRLSEQDGALFEFEDLMNLRLKGDNLAQFQNDWNICLSGQRKLPPPDILENLYLRQLERSQQLDRAMALYHDGITLKGEEKDYDRLTRIVSAHLERKDSPKIART